MIATHVSPQSHQVTGYVQGCSREIAADQFLVGFVMLAIERQFQGVTGTVMEMGMRGYDFLESLHVTEFLLALAIEPFTEHTFVIFRNHAWIQYFGTGTIDHTLEA
jgi:hypothetical protein